MVDCVQGCTRHIVWRELLRLLPYTIAGALIGLYYFNAFDGRSLARGLGAVVLALTEVTLCGVNRCARLAEYRLLVALDAAGVWHAGRYRGRIVRRDGGRVLRDLSSICRRLDKDQIPRYGCRALLALGIVRGGGYFAVGAYDHEALIATAFALPLMFAGVVLGNHIHTGLSENAFRRMIGIVLIVSGLPLLFG